MTHCSHPDCAFWSDWLSRADDGTVLTSYDGEIAAYHFRASSPLVTDERPEHLPFCGALWAVSFADGRHVMTNCLSYVGIIPRSHAEGVEANAVVREWWEDDGTRQVLAVGEDSYAVPGMRRG